MLIYERADACLCSRSGPRRVFLCPISATLEEMASITFVKTAVISHAEYYKGYMISC